MMMMSLTAYVLFNI